MPRALPVIVAVAFALRLGSGLTKGPDFVAEGYSFYADMAQTFWTGGGLCYAPDEACAVRLPLYPILVAPFLAAAIAYPWLIVFQAAVGAMQPLLAYALGAHLFNMRVGVIAALGAAMNPYAIVHDPSFQDTVIFNALIALAVWLLLRAARRNDKSMSVAAGLALALAMLTTARMVLFIPMALAWMIAVRRDAPVHTRAVQTACVALPVILLLGGWIARNQRAVGSPVLTTEFGLSLWLANSPETMAFIPNRSIDLVEAPLRSRLAEEHRRVLEQLVSHPVAEDRYYARLGFEYIVSHPWATIGDAAEKVFFGFSGWLSPARGGPIQAAFLVVFGPLTALGLAGLWRQRRAGRDHALVALLLLSFTMTTAVFWAHTSHQSFLHVFLFVYAAAMLTNGHLATPRRNSA